MYLSKGQQLKILNRFLTCFTQKENTKNHKILWQLK